MYQFRDLILKNKHDIKYLGYDFIWDISHKKIYTRGHTNLSYVSALIIDIKSVLRIKQNLL